MAMSVRPSVRPSVHPSDRVSGRQSQFSALFSYMLLHIELKFCMSLSSYRHSIKFECLQFPSIFVRVMPLLELNILEIHCSLTCFDILGWNFAYDWFPVLHIKFLWRQCPSIFVGVMILLDLRMLKIHSFSHISLTCFDILSWKCAYDFVLLYYRSSNECRQFA